jgi:carbon storage regulator
MLVLSRRTGQSIVIADEVVVSVVSICGGRVQLGVSAPVDCPVHREEIHRRIQQESAARGDSRRSANREAVLVG